MPQVTWEKLTLCNRAAFDRSFESMQQVVICLQFYFVACGIVWCCGTWWIMCRLIVTGIPTVQRATERNSLVENIYRVFITLPRQHNFSRLLLHGGNPEEVYPRYGRKHRPFFVPYPCDMCSIQSLLRPYFYKITCLRAALKLRLENDVAFNIFK